MKFFFFLYQELNEFAGTIDSDLFAQAQDAFTPSDDESHRFGCDVSTGCQNVNFEPELSKFGIPTRPL